MTCIAIGKLHSPQAGRSNENEITIAYMTSGNIAVFDHDVRRYVDFLERLAAEGKVEPNSVVPLAKKVYDFLNEKKAGDVDIPGDSGHQARDSRVRGGERARVGWA